MVAKRLYETVTVSIVRMFLSGARILLGIKERVVESIESSNLTVFFLGICNSD